MNILTQSLPETVTVDGREYPIDADFRSCLNIVLAFDDAELTGQEKQAILLNNLFIEMPDNIEAALTAASLFINGNQPRDEETEAQPVYYSFQKDSRFIFSAFQQVHKIDLETTSLHWWKFCALFVGLFGSETPFANLVSLRQRVHSGKATKEERQAAEDMGDMFVIEQPDTRTQEEKEAEAEFLRLLGQGK
jgi:hypothetical protein